MRPSRPPSSPAGPPRPLRLGLVGLDASHVEDFTELFNNPAHPDHVPGGRVVAAFPGGSADFPLSIGRVGKYQRKLRDEYGLAMLRSAREVAESVDAVLLTSIDGRVHRSQFAEIADCRKPVFVNKPFALSRGDAGAMARLARSRSVPVFSSSSLRFASALREALADRADGPVIGAEFSGPLKLEPTQPGFFWYGIHAAEMLYAALGPGCAHVQVVSSADHDAAVGVWRDGRIGIVRGNRVGNGTFTGVIHREKRSRWIDAAAGRPPAAGQVEAMMRFFQGGPSPVALDETLELIRFLEAANESRLGGGRRIPL